MTREWEQGGSINHLDYVVDGIYKAYVRQRNDLWYTYIFYGGIGTYHATLDEAKAVAMALVAMR